MLISQEAILRHITAALSIGDALAAEISLKIAEGPLLPADRSAVILAINLKLDSSDLTPADKCRAKMQSFESAYNYLTASDVAVLGSHRSLQDKMSYIAQRFVKLGLMHPTEKTYATLVAISMFGSEITIDSEILGMVRQLKRIFRNITARLPLVDAPILYPKTPAEFKAKFLLLYEAAYTSEEPVVVADETAWLCRISNVPLRCTKTGCASPLDASITRQGATKQQHATVALMQMLAQQQRLTSGAQAADPFTGLQNLQIFSGSGSSSGNLQLPANPPQLLAIEGQPVGLRYSSMASFASNASGSSDGAQGSSASHAAGAQPSLQDDSQASSASLAIPAQPVVAAAAASAVDCMVAQLQLQLKGKFMKRPAAAAAAGPVADEQGNVVKRPAAAAAAELVDGQRLGCSKCRYGPGGCKQCRVVSFTGKRQKE
jgi:hypothetical protein